MRVVVMTGRVFGRLTVLRKTGVDGKGYVTWQCRCDHGGKGRPKRLVVSGQFLRDGKKKSCGCLRVEVSRRQGKSFLRHGLSRTPLYQVWRNMMARCYRPANKDFKYYGGRGVRVCQEWKTSDNFFAWALSNGYREGLTIERRNNNLGYHSSNCGWIPQSQQPGNRINSLRFDWKGKNRSLVECCKMEGLAYHVVQDRLKRGWSFKDAITHKSNRYSKLYRRVGAKLVRVAA